MRLPRHNNLCKSLITCLLLLTSHASAFYLPGVAPTSYKEGDIVPLYVNRLTPSVSTGDLQVRSALSFDYYSDPFHFCQPEQIAGQHESLGSIIFGDRIANSPFELRMKQDQKCRTIKGCGEQTFSKEDAQFVNKRIYQSFNLNWLVDGLPAGEEMIDSRSGDTFYSPGFALGVMKDNKAVFNNHYDIIIDYHEPSRDQFRVVGVEVQPSSNAKAKDTGDGSGECPQPPEPIVLREDAETKLVFTYSVTWHESSTPFATRWDKYLHVYDPKIHWFSLVNAAVIVVFLSAMVFVILVRTLKRDITRYNKLDAFVLEDMGNGGAGGADFDDNVQEDSGWKLIHGDVFRPPRQAMLLSILVGNGAQLFMMTGFTIAFALLGFLSPSNRGSLGSVMVLLYTLFGGIGGFFSSYTYKALSVAGHSNGDESKNPNYRWKRNMLLTPLALPSVVFGTFFLLDLFLWGKGASGAVPFTTMLVIIAIWFLISTPLSLAGSWLALRRRAPQPPVRTNQIPRQIPEPGAISAGSSTITWLARPVPAVILTGIPPFVAIFFELYFIMASLWSAKIYYMFGFLFLCFGLMVVTCATVTVLAVYFLLCAENYHWQWRSFVTGGACSVYVFLHALGFWASRLSFGSLTSAVLYLGYSLLISGLVFVLTGEFPFFS
ncbi:MAG: hypothetical protein M1831_001109 [Alyxoria varia]|nr:MAG: hypothetical protein M1831_001109 [Alyxoria varia]